MSLYQCDMCGCVENTAVGHYHCRHMKDLYAEEFIDKALCSACGPTEHLGGSKTEYGEWHNKFPRKYYKLNSLYTDDEGNVRNIYNKQYPTVSDEI